MDEQSGPTYLSFITQSQDTIREASARFRTGDIDGGSRVMRGLEVQLSDPRIREDLGRIAAAGIPQFSEAADFLASGGWREPLADAQTNGAKKSRAFLISTLGERAGDLQDKVNRGSATDQEAAALYRLTGSAAALGTPMLDERGKTKGYVPNVSAAVASEDATKNMLGRVGIKPADVDYSASAGDLRPISDFAVMVGGEADAMGVTDVLVDLTRKYAGETATQPGPADSRAQLATLTSFGTTLQTLSAATGGDSGKQTELIGFLKSVGKTQGVDARMFRDSERMKRGFTTYLRNREAFQVVQKQKEILNAMGVPGAQQITGWDPVSTEEMARYSLLGDDDPMKASPAEQQLEVAQDIMQHQERVANYSAGFTGAMNPDGTRQAANPLQQAAGRAYEAAIAAMATADAMGRTDLSSAIMRSGVGKFKQELRNFGVSQEALKAMDDEKVLTLLGEVLDVNAVGAEPAPGPTLGTMIAGRQEVLFGAPVTPALEPTDQALQRVTQELKVANENPGSVPSDKLMSLRLAHRRLGEARELEQIGSGQFSGAAGKELDRINSLTDSDKKKFYEELGAAKAKAKAIVGRGLAGFTDDKGSKVTYDSRDGFFSGGKSKGAFRRAVENGLAGLAVDKRVVEALVNTSEGQPLDVVKQRISDIIETHAVAGRVLTLGPAFGAGLVPVASAPSVAAPSSVITGLRASAGEPAARKDVREAEKGIARAKQRSAVDRVLSDVERVDPDSAQILQRFVRVSPSIEAVRGSARELAYESKDLGAKLKYLESHDRADDAILEKRIKEQKIPADKQRLAMDIVRAHTEAKDKGDPAGAEALRKQYRAWTNMEIEDVVAPGTSPDTKSPAVRDEDE
jgi:hypothetical protein